MKTKFKKTIGQRVNGKADCRDENVFTGTLISFLDLINNGRGSLTLIRSVSGCGHGLQPLLLLFITFVRALYMVE